MIEVIFAVLAGVTIVLSRSVNGYLAQKTGPYLSTFFNYFTGFIVSLVILLFVGGQFIDVSTMSRQPTMFLGGVIGVFNILILNIVVTKISPVKLTLIAFVAQLSSGMILDYCFYGIFSLNKVIGCAIVILGLVIYQLSDQKDVA